MRIVLVEPQHPGNVGAVARVMANFGIDDLALVNGCEINDDGFARSKSGRPILEKLKRFDTMKEALADCDIAIATSGIKPKGDKRWFRAPKNVKNINKIIELPHLIVEGIMTILPINQTEKETKRLYNKTKKIRDEISKTHNIDLELSMGMSNDYKTAIKCGATLVRIGTKLFGGRK